MTNVVSGTTLQEVIFLLLEYRGTFDLIWLLIAVDDRSNLQASILIGRTNNCPLMPYDEHWNRLDPNEMYFGEQLQQHPDQWIQQ